MVDRAQRALAGVAGAPRDALGRGLRDVDEELAALDALRERPRGELAQDRGADAAAAVGRGDDVAELGLAQLAVEGGDEAEAEQLAVVAETAANASRVPSRRAAS